MDNRKQLWELIYRTTRVMVETQAAAHRTHVIRNRTFDDGLADSLNEKRLSPYLIMEEFSDEDANKLESAVQELTKIVEDMGKKLGDAGMDGTASALTDLAGSIPDTAGIASLAIKGDTDALQKQTGEVNEALSQVQEAVALIVASLTDLGTNLGNFEGKLEDDQKEKTIQELAEDEDLVKAGNFVDAKSLEKGVGKAFKVPGWFKSAVNKGMSAAKGAKEGGVMGFFKGLFGGGGKKKLIDQKVFTQDVLKTPFNKFMEVSKAMSGAQGPLEAAIGGSAEAGATAQAAAGAPGEEAPAEVEDPKKPEKRPGFDLMAWIEEKFPDLFKRLQQADVDAGDEDAQEIDAAVEDGDISPEEAIEDMEAEAGKMKAADALEALKKALEPDDDAKEKFGIPDDFDPEAIATPVVDSLKDKELVEESWRHHPTLEYLLEARKMALLLEQDEEVLTADELTSIASGQIDDETQAAWAAWKMYTGLKDAGMEIEGEVPEPEPGEGEEEGEKVDWAVIRTNVINSLSDELDPKGDYGAAVFDALEGQKDFLINLKDLVKFKPKLAKTLEESRSPFYTLSLRDLLLEADAVDFEELKKLGGADGLDDEANVDGVFAAIAKGINDEIGEEVISGIKEPEEGEEEGEEGGEPTDEEQDASEDAAEGAADEAIGADMDPVAGIAKVVGDWATSTKTLEKNISGKQTDALKKAAVDVVGKAQEMVIQGMMDAVDAWRGTQKVLQKPHTSDKQIDALKQGLDAFLKDAITVEEAVSLNASTRMERRLRDKMTRFLLEATDLRKQRLDRLDTWDLIETFTIAYCDTWADNEPAMMTESSENHGFGYTYDHVDSYDESELVRHKWMRMAGLPGF